MNIVVCITGWDFIVKRLFFGLIVCWLTACGSTQPAQNEEVLPTLASLEQPREYPLDGAIQTALDFLDRWQAGDFPAMYALTTFSSQEATPLENFTRIYQTTQNEMTLESLTYTGVTAYRDPSRADVALFNYNITFSTRLLGEFADNDRNLSLVVDPSTEEWRVAWTAGDIFKELAGGGQLRLEISPPSRANIYDRDDLVLADQNGRSVIVRAVKQEIADWSTCLPLIAPAVNKNPVDVQKIYDESSADWLMELGTIEPATYESSSALLEAACAARFSSQPTRRYPNGTIAPNIVGAVGLPDEAELPAVEAAGFDSDSIIGKSGIERSWDERLRGQPGGRLLIVTPGGQILREVARSASHPPESVWLTLETDLQAKVTEILASYYENAKDSWAQQSNGAAAVVLNVRTGEILAMVSYPTFDANVFSPFPSMGRQSAAQLMAQLQADTRRPLLNRATQGVYPLGSVMKVVSATAAADSGVYALDQRYACSGIWNRDITRYDWLAGGHGTLNLAGALTQSCNPYFYEVGYQLNEYDINTLPDYAMRMGLGVPTGLTDIAESPGLIPNPEWKRTVLGLEWTFSDAVNISIGQGEVQVTPLQVARMMAAVANGGYLYQPQLVWKVGILGEAPSYTMTPELMGNINVRPEVMAVIHEGLCAVTTERAGTAEFQFRDSPLQTLGVCGKTGTAQNRPGAVTHAWFAAWAPKDDPEIAVAVIVENGGEGSGVAAPITRDIMEYYFFR